MTSPTRSTPPYQRPTPHQRFTPLTASGSTAVVESGVSAAAARRLRVAALIVLAVSVFGIFTCDFLVAAGIADGGRLRPGSFPRLYALNEPPFFWLLGGFAALVWLLASGRSGVGTHLQRLSTKALFAPALFAAIAVALVAAAGAVAVMHSAGGPAALVNPLHAAISIVSLAGASTRLWPGDVRRGRLAILYLATSTQFVLVSMTSHPWATHLSINLLWLYLVLRDDRFGLAAAPWVGVAALGVQSPVPHALLAAPFLLRVLRTGRVGWIAYYGAVYGAGILALQRWTLLGPADAAPGPSLKALLGLTAPAAERFLAQGMDLSALFTWQAPAMALFLVVSALLVRSLRGPERDLFTGLVLTVAFYAVFPETGAHNWGYRQVYPVLGAAALLAASATVTIAGQRGGALVSRLVVVSTAMALLIQLPLRAVQAEWATRPRAAAPVVPKAPPSARPRTVPKR